MAAAPLPPDEKERLQVIRRYAILDTPREVAFDRITSLAARLLQVPIVLVTLVDEKRQWFKACHGVDIRETSRDVSFCAHTILQNEVMIVPDATKDDRFADNSLVTGDFGLRFYAGIPLKGADGVRFGTLCVIDTCPRELSAEDQAILWDLAEITMDEFQLRLATLENNQLAAAVFNVDSGVIVTDALQPGNPIIYCNPAFCRLSGYSPKEVVGNDCGFLQGPKTDAVLMQSMHDALKEHRLFQGLMLNYRKGGTPFWNELIISPVFDKDGRLVNYVGLQNDVSDRKNAEDALRENYEKLRQLEKLRDNLTHMIIHDMRGPINVAIGFLDLLKLETGGQLSQLAIEAIDYAEESAHQLKDMATSLLDVSRLESGEMPLEMSRYDLGELAMEYLASLVTLHGASRLTLELPPAPLLVCCDPDLVRRVIGNLVGNALKFTPPLGKVCVRVTRKGSAACLCVIDNGPGISSGDHVRIFEKFGQVGEIKRAHSTGLGLAFCKLAVEAQDGRIGVESRKGQGSVFWFSLPVVSKAALAERKHGPVEPPATAQWVEFNRLL